MKIRHGFVSNSSSSSFVVRHRLILDEIHGIKPRLSDKQIKLLKDYGFFAINHDSPSELELGIRRDADYKSNIPPEPRVDEDDFIIEVDQYFKFELNYGYYIMCNQGEVITWLLENRIPFLATINYGHQHVFWKGGNHKMVIAQNYGLWMEMYGVDDVMVKYHLKQPSIERISRKEFLERGHL